MSGHTPGPWTADETIVLFPKMAGGFDIRNCPNPAANARLIAAAPDLLEALTDLVANQDATWTASGFTDEQIKAMPYLKPARAAIAKATEVKQ